MKMKSLNENISNVLIRYFINLSLYEMKIKQHRALQQSQITEISNLIQTGESPGTAPPHQRHASDSNSVSLAENQNEEEDSEGSVMVESS